ncbi:MAG: glycoside hydrolase family 3 N-terminal domain-containing protein [Pseudomonadota bacterium]
MLPTAAIIDATGLRLTPQEKALFRELDPFGFILFARNIDTPAQVRALCDEMREAVGRDALITVDQEGGRVQRLQPPVWRAWPAPLDVVTAAGLEAPRALYVMYRLIADELYSLGIDSNCAPVLDLVTDATHPFLKNRCYGSDPTRVAELGRAVATALLAGGVLPVMKHMPGHGRTVINSHHALPRVDTPLDVLQATDFLPFKELRDLPMGMTAHQVFSAVDDHAATHSEAMIKLIREVIGFENLIMTDDSAMEALEGSPASRAQAAIAAGVDIVLHCNAPLVDRRAVCTAAGEMSPPAQARAAQALALRRRPDEIDIPALEREFDALMSGAVDG